MFRFPIRALSCLAMLCVLWPLAAARAEQPYQRLLPLLVDLGGWQGKKPDGMSMESSEMKMTTASRDYQRGAAEAQASVIMGQAAVSAMPPMETGMNIQTPQGHMMTTTMRGMTVLKSYDTQEKSGALMVALGKDALFTLSFKGIGEDEGLALSEKFDWKALQAAAQAK